MEHRITGLKDGIQDHTSADGLAFTTAVHTLVVDTGQACGLTLLSAHAALPRNITTLLGAHAIDIGKRWRAACACRQHPIVWHIIMLYLLVSYLATLSYFQA
jgi:hypothetical protein